MNNQEVDLMEEKIERAIAQSKKLLSESRKNNKVRAIIEAQKDKINARIKSDDIKPIENGYVLKNGNTLTLVQDIVSKDEKRESVNNYGIKPEFFNQKEPKQTLLDKFYSKLGKLLIDDDNFPC